MLWDNIIVCYDMNIKCKMNKNVLGEVYVSLDKKLFITLYFIGDEHSIRVSEY